MSPIIVAAVIVFVGVLIFVHELGHFLAAKLFNIKVLKFSLGFGRPLIHFTRGETTYQIAFIPLGGYVKMLGDVPTDEIPPEDRHRAFTTSPVYQRAIIAIAGPVFNLVFPILCFGAYHLLGPTVIAPIVGQVEIGTAAEAAGLKSGDRVLSIDGKRIWDFQRMTEIVKEHANEALHFTIEREGKPVELTITPRPTDGEDDWGNAETHGMIGVSPAVLGTRIGVEGKHVAELGLRTGDRILTANGNKITRLSELEELLEKNKGRTVEVVVARPEARALGDLLVAQREEVVKVLLAVPTDIEGLATLGVYPSDAFIRYLEPNGAAMRAGVRSGDRVVAVNGRPVSMFLSFAMAMQRAEKKPVTVTVARDGERIELAVVNDEKQMLHPTTGLMRPYFDAGLGLGDAPRSAATMNWHSGGTWVTETAQLSIGEAFIASVMRTGEGISMTVVSLYKLFSGDVSPKTVGGPLLLFQVAAQAAEFGVFAYLRLLALISVNLGVFNLLPVPLLDGGHLLFCAVEAIKRKPMSLRVRERAAIVGLVLLAMAIVWVFANDISRLLG
ncbi:MAG: RIP metalloprotease RseP [Myxococcota bacterium]